MLHNDKKLQRAHYFRCRASLSGNQIRGRHPVNQWDYKWRGRTGTEWHRFGKNSITHYIVIYSVCCLDCGEWFLHGSSTERSLSPSDTELSSPELAVCYDLQEEDDVTEENEQEISENGQEVLSLKKTKKHTYCICTVSCTNLLGPKKWCYSS